MRSLYSKGLMGKEVESPMNDPKDLLNDLLKEDQETRMHRVLGEDPEREEGDCPSLDEVTWLLIEKIDELDGENDDKVIDRDELHAALAAEGLTEMCMDEVLEASILIVKMQAHAFGFYC